MEPESEVTTAQVATCWRRWGASSAPVLVACSVLEWAAMMARAGLDGAGIGSDDGAGSAACMAQVCSSAPVLAACRCWDGQR